MATWGGGVKLILSPNPSSRTCWLNGAEASNSNNHWRVRTRSWLTDPEESSHPESGSEVKGSLYPDMKPTRLSGTFSQANSHVRCIRFSLADELVSHDSMRSQSRRISSKDRSPWNQRVCQLVSSVNDELQLHSNYYFPFLKEYMYNKCALHRQDMSEHITVWIRA